jgi:hypothetical protein
VRWRADREEIQVGREPGTVASPSGFILISCIRPQAPAQWYLIRRVPIERQTKERTISVVDQFWSPSRLGLNAAVDAEQIGVDENVASLNTELLKQSLDTTPGLADQYAANDGLVLRGILADHQYNR